MTATSEGLSPAFLPLFSFLIPYLFSFFFPVFVISVFYRFFFVSLGFFFFSQTLSFVFSFFSAILYFRRSFAHTLLPSFIRCFRSSMSFVYYFVISFVLSFVRLFSTPLFVFVFVSSLCSFIVVI